MTLGEPFEIGLVERPTTGFRWRLVEVPDGIELIETAYLASPYKPENTKRSELRFSAVLGSGASEVRFERATLS